MIFTVIVSGASAPRWYEEKMLLFDVLDKVKAKGLA
jgi:hypothetical protein